jgi:hypothetical protein
VDHLAGVTLRKSWIQVRQYKSDCERIMERGTGGQPEDLFVCSRKECQQCVQDLADDGWWLGGVTGAVKDSRLYCL